MANKRTPGVMTPFSSSGSGLSPLNLKTPGQIQTLELPEYGDDTASTASLVTKAMGKSGFKKRRELDSFSVMTDIWSRIRSRQSTIYSRRASTPIISGAL